MLNKRELYNEIIRLRQEGKTYREISKILHVSPSQISAALKEFEGTNTEPSIQTKAYKMFLEGKRPIDVSIALRLGNKETINFWKEYLELTGQYRLLRIADELNENLQRFLNIYNGIKKKGLTLEEIEEGIKRAREYDAVFDDQMARKEKLSYDLEEQIKAQKNTIANLKIEVQALGIVKILVSKIVENLAREKNRLDLIPYYPPRFGPPVNRYFIPTPGKPI